MHRSALVALATSALAAIASGAAPASADPLSLQPDRYGAQPDRMTTQSISRRAAPDYVAPERIAPVRYAATEPQQQGNLGGGFIEFLFGNGRPVAPPRPPTDVYASTNPGAAVEQVTDTDHPPMDPKYEKQVVAYNGPEKPGTVIIDTPQRFLFLVQDHGTALRYGIGVGRPGFTWAGVKTVTAKKEWPDWTPPPEMIQRRPDLPGWMAGGPENPLGARAMYLGSSLYRIHGSNEPETIGQAVSSGCIRLTNDDVIDLYNRVKIGATVVVMQQ
jgi:lipoprotein-anchoring transpeptidase ErfK/SrfK